MQLVLNLRGILLPFAYIDISEKDHLGYKEDRQYTVPWFSFP